MQIIQRTQNRPLSCRMNILLSLRRQEQYYRLFLGGFAAMPLTVGIIKRFIRFIRNKYKIQNGRLGIHMIKPRAA